MSTSLASSTSLCIISPVANAFIVYENTVGLFQQFVIEILYQNTAVHHCIQLYLMLQCMLILKHDFCITYITRVSRGLVIYKPTATLYIPNVLVIVSPTLSQFGGTQLPLKPRGTRASRLTAIELTQFPIKGVVDPSIDHCFYKYIEFKD